MAFVSGGSLVTVKTPTLLDSSYFVGMPPMAGTGWPSAYGAIYRRQLWVYTVISKRARATARLPLVVYERNADDRPRVNDHPMAKLLNYPNPGLSGFDLWMWTSSTHDIYGQAFWYKDRTKGEVTGLYPLHPSHMQFNREKQEWRFDNGTQVMDHIKGSDVVHFPSYDPDGLNTGLSPMEPLRATLENEWSAQSATSSFWAKGARPAMALTHPAQLSEPAQQRLKAQFDDQHGGARNTGKTLILEEGMTPQPLTLSAVEAQYIDTRKLNREEVCGAYDIPPPVVHILDRATFSNITEQMRSMYRDTMAPILKKFEATIDLELRRREWPDDSIYAEFLMDEVLRGDFEARQDALGKAAHMTIAEKRRIENLPFIEGTDRIFLNTATMPLDAIDAQAAATVAHTEANGPTATIPQTVARSVMGRLSWQESLADVDPKALVEGLNGTSATVLGAWAAEHECKGTIAGLRDRIQSMAVEG